MEKKSQKVHIKRLSELKTAIVQGDVDRLKTLNKTIAFKGDLKKCLTIEANPFRNTNAVILACKEKRVEILKYLLSRESKIIENSSGSIQPTDKDETHHNAFYYAMRSGDPELVQMLIRHFSVHLQKLDEAISRAYEELKINNVPLSNEVKFFIEQQLIDMRFYAENSQRSDSVEDFIKTIKERVALVVESAKLVREISTTAEIDEECLYTLKFVAQNINVLKQKLRSTYDRLPWEEIEFCLTIFISTYCTKQEINLYWNACLEGHKILTHLETFLKILEGEIENLTASRIGDLTAPIKQKRSVIVESIISRCPEFKGLYEMYHQIRDIHTLERISETLKIGLGADVHQREGKILISRMLQVLGEYMKNTLESPKLSEGTNALLLVSLPKSTRRLVLRLRDSISHIDSLFKRMEIENTKEDRFFNDILADLKGIGILIDDTLQAKKNNILSELIKKVQEAEAFDEYCKVLNTFRDNYSTDFWKNNNFDKLVNNHIIELVEELSRIVPDQTDHEKQLFQQINSECRSVQEVLIDVDYQRAILKSFLKCISYVKHNDIFNFRNLRECIFCKQNVDISEGSKYPDLKKIAMLIFDVFQSVKIRSVQPYVNDFERTMWLVIGMLSNPDVKWIQDLEFKLKEELPPRTSSRNTKNSTPHNYKNQLSKKKQELESILKKMHASSQSLFGSFEVYKEDKKLQAVVEMIVLDIMSIVAALKIEIGSNFLFVDDVCPVLVGKCLRNHLAHNNELLTVLLDDGDRVIFLNAMKLIAEDLDGKEKKPRCIPVAENISCLKKRHDDCRRMLNMKRVMFAACEEGSIDELKTSVRNGADVNSRGREGHGVLHFASKGGSTELLEFLLNRDRSLCLSTHELEEAVSNGSRHTVEFIVKRMGMPPATEDKLSLLHIAAKNGHKDVVEYLIENKSDPKRFAQSGLPIHYAAQCNHKDVVELLLKNGANSIEDEGMFGLSLLHIAAKCGYIELVEYLLEFGANPNAKAEKGLSTPLHFASFHGCLEIVKMLVMKGAAVNAQRINGNSPIYLATENNQAKIVSFLLDHGANVNTADRVFKNTSLHIACKKGYTNIVEELIENGAQVNVFNIHGFTPIQSAVASGHYDIYLILLAHGADEHVKTTNNETLLHFAAMRGQQAMAVRLIDRKLEVNAKNMDNITPLLIAAYNGHEDMVDLLLKSGASVDLRNNEGNTSLHAAVFNDHIKVIGKLINSGASIEAKNKYGTSPLCLALNANQNDVIALLIKHGAAITDIEFKVAIQKGNINMVKLMASKLNIKNKSLCLDALCLAVEYECTEIVTFLIRNGVEAKKIREADTKLLKLAVSTNNKEILRVLLDHGVANENSDSINQALFEAVKFGHPDMVDILLKKCDSVDKCFDNGIPILVKAALKGYIKIFKSLIKKCNKLDLASHDGTTALHLAAILGRKEIVEILLGKGANVNAQGDDGGTALHLAAARNDNPEIVKVLLSKGADETIEDKKQCTALQLAVANNKLEIVKTLLSGSRKKYINYIGTNEGVSLLHIAAQRLNMDMVRYLIEQGADCDIEDMNGAKPIYHAAREGSIEIVKYLLSKGSSLNETGPDGRTLLHYATMTGQIQLVEYLIAESANLNAKTTKLGHTPLHCCVLFGSKDVARVLLNNGAMYNVIDKLNNKPEDMVENQRFYVSEDFLKDIKRDNISTAINERNEIVELLKSTDKLLKAVKRNDICTVSKCIEEGAILNAKDIRDNMALHYAARKGYAPIAEVLLSAKAKPNVSVKDGSTPLHYSAKCSHFDVAKILLSHGAIYNSINDSKSTPFDLATDAAIKELLKVIDDLFKYVAKGSERVLIELGKIKNSDTLKAVVNARNENNKTLVMVAKLCDFPKLKELTEILIGDFSFNMDIAELFVLQDKFKEALVVYEYALEQIKIKLGPNNLLLLDVKKKIGRMLYEQSKYNEALCIFTEVYDIQTEFLGSDHNDALNARGAIALVLQMQEKYNEALDIYNDILRKQEKVLEPTSEGILNTQFDMAIVLGRLHRNEDSLTLLNEIYEVCNKKWGLCRRTLAVLQNTAIVLCLMSQYEKAIEIMEKVYEMSTRLLWPNHSDALSALFNMAKVYMSMGRYEDATTRFIQVFNIQKKVLGLQHPYTLRTQFNIGYALYKQTKLIASLKIFGEFLRTAEPIFGPEDEGVLTARALSNSINSLLNMYESKDVQAHLDIVIDSLKNLNMATSEGAEQTT